MPTCKKNVERVLVISQIMVAQGCNIAKENLVAQRHNISEGQTFPPHICECLPSSPWTRKRGALWCPLPLWGKPAAVSPRSWTAPRLCKVASGYSAMPLSCPVATLESVFPLEGFPGALCCSEHGWTKYAVLSPES